MPSSPSPKVAIVEDQTIFRELLAEVLTSDPAGYQVAQFSNGRSALEGCREWLPHLVILDVILPDLSGLDVLRELTAWQSRLPVLMVTGHARPALVQQAAKWGARGIVTKGTPLSELRRAVGDILAGGRYFCSVTSQLMADALRGDQGSEILTPRQREIVQLIAQGQSSKEIAAELDISLKTVANHRFQIREKLQLGDVASLTRYAIERGLVEPKV